MGLRATLAALSFFIVHCGRVTADDLGVDASPQECPWPPVLSEANACFGPGDVRWVERTACCDTQGTDVAAHCEKFFPGGPGEASKPVPVFCADGDMPLGLDCAEIPTTQFGCAWGDSALVCCPVAE